MGVCVGDFMNNAISSFSLIRSFISSGGDYLGAFMPLAIKLIADKGYYEITIEDIVLDFEKEYGLRIPRHPMESIVNKLKPNYLSQSKGKIFINRQVIEEGALSFNFDEEKKHSNKLRSDFIKYCRDHQPSVEISAQEAESLFLEFFRDHDLDILISQTNNHIESIIPKVSEHQRSDHQFLLFSFINKTLLEGGDNAEHLNNASLGHLFANTILIRDFPSVRGKGFCDNYYFDIGILFDITGINQTFRKNAAIELLNRLKGRGSNLFIFQHTLDEFLTIIENCTDWIESNLYDPTKASSALNYFKDEGYRIVDIHSFQQNVRPKLKELGVNIANPIDPNFNQQYQIDRNELKNIILDIYESSNYYFDQYEKEDTIDRDITSVEYIYKLRKHISPINLNEAAHVFITANTSLARATVIYEKEILKRTHFTIPPVLTDTFVGTLTWIQEPTEFISTYNLSKLIHYTSAAIQPNKLVITKFLETLRNPDSIGSLREMTDQDPTMLFETKLSREMLAEVTLGDPSRVTSDTPHEVMAKIKSELIKQERKNSDKFRHDAELAEKEKLGALKTVEIISKENLEQRVHLEKLITRITAFGTYGLAIIITFIYIAIYLYFDVFAIQNARIKIIASLIALVPISIGWVVHKKASPLLKNKIRPFLLTHPDENQGIIDENIKAKQ